MEDPNFTKMLPEYKKRYREMIRKDKEDKDEKARIKAEQEEKKKKEEALKKLYPNSNMD